jgi:hypothetical protein
MKLFGYNVVFVDDIRGRGGSSLVAEPPLLWSQQMKKSRRAPLS